MLQVLPQLLAGHERLAVPVADWTLVARAVELSMLFHLVELQPHHLLTAIVWKVAKFETGQKHFVQRN